MKNLKKVKSIEDAVLDEGVPILYLTEKGECIIPTPKSTDPFNGHEYINLGLPSGTLWATCNVGANSPEEYGDYFAFGETEPKEFYALETYKWGNGETNAFLTKYCTNSDWGIVDNKTILDKEDDAAFVNWGGNWRTPTLEEFQELMDYCAWSTIVEKNEKVSISESTLKSPDSLDLVKCYFKLNFCPNDL